MKLRLVLGVMLVGMASACGGGGDGGNGANSRECATNDCRNGENQAGGAAGSNGTCASAVAGAVSAANPAMAAAMLNMRRDFTGISSWVGLPSRTEGCTRIWRIRLWEKTTPTATSI